MPRKISVKLSGVPNDAYHGGRLSSDFLYISSSPDKEYVTQVGYVEGSSELASQRPVLFNYVADASLHTSADQGVYISEASGSSMYSFYKREYGEFSRMEYDSALKQMVSRTEVYKGPWQPVAVHIKDGFLRDFNVASGYSYQYIIYPESTVQKQQFANNDDWETANETGSPVKVNWNEWSLSELIPVKNSLDSPSVKKMYQVDIDNVWLFKYSLETGAITQNIKKNETETLGQFPKIYSSNLNYDSGEVSCLLGSEIIPYTGIGYIERLRGAIATPLSTNEKNKMLQQWKKIVSSRNPKLLKDAKGQSWIVQIVSGSSATKNNYTNRPEVITFSWKQVDNTENVVIYGSGEERPTKTSCQAPWVMKK